MLFYLSHSGCEVGRFGLSCGQSCDCTGEAQCDPSTGRCLCPPGRTGQRCEEGRCPPQVLHAVRSRIAGSFPLRLHFQSVLRAALAPAAPCCASVPMGPTVTGRLADACARSPGWVPPVATVNLSSHIPKHTQTHTQTWAVKLQRFG